MDCPCRCLMLNSPVSIHTVLCTMRSRMASAMVSPPRRLCHSLVASWVANVYGQINVYSVTTKSERYERSYWTRTAAGNGIGGRKAPVPYGS